MKLDFLAKVAGKAKLLWKVHKHDILFFGGMIVDTLGTVDACRATLNLPDILDDCNKRMGEARETGDKGLVTRTYIGNIARVAGNYARPVLLMAVGKGCLTGSHQSLKKENAALTAAYVALEEKIRNGRKDVKVRAIPEQEQLEGEVEANPEEFVETIDISDPWTIVFGPGDRYYVNGDMAANYQFCLKKIAQLDDRLAIRQFISWNDILETMGKPLEEGMFDFGYVKTDPSVHVLSSVFEMSREEVLDLVNNEVDTIVIRFDGIGSIKDIFHKSKKRAIVRSQLIREAEENENVLET